MGSPITLSGFNSIDFNQILTAVMLQERLPVTQLESEKKVLDAQKSAFSTLASKLASLESATEALRAAEALEGTIATVSDATRLEVSAEGHAPQGTYQVVVNQLARAQVTTGAGAASRETIVATGGSLVIGDTTVSISGPTTLDQLASSINSTEGIDVTASVVRTSGGYELMLTGKATGAANTFALTNSLSGGAATLTFTDRQAARDAAVTINGVAVTSDSNTFTGVVAGASFTALREDANSPITVRITASSESVKALVDKFRVAFNDVVRFLDDQQAASRRGEANNIGRDPLVRGLRSSLASILTASYPASGAHTSLAQIGFAFSRTGTLEFDAATFTDALASGTTGIREMFRGTDGQGGVFGALVSAVSRYTEADGLVPDAQERLTSQSRKISDRIVTMEERLELRRQSLQREFIAADQAIAQLNAQRSQLGGLSSSLF
jgi:flagellar hook-associated protein 2